MHILIICEESDFHAKMVKERLVARGAHVTCWNTSWHPWKNTAYWSNEASGFETDDIECSLSEFDAIWWRRYGRPTVSPLIDDANVKRFCQSESNELLRGMFLAHRGVVNNLTAELEASSKILQLQRASKLGISVPDTVVTNNASLAMRFFESHSENCIIKTLYCDYPTSIPTRIVTREDLQLDVFSLAPAIIQECISCVKDIRASIVGDEIFAAELFRENSDDEVDWRKDPHGWKPHKLPPLLANQLRQLVRSFGLAMAAVDLRLDKQGHCKFNGSVQHTR